MFCGYTLRVAITYNLDDFHWKGQLSNLWCIDRIPLTCLGRFKAKLKAGMTTINGYVYVIEGEAESLLGRKSCFDLEILKPVKSVKQVELNCGKVSDTRLNSLLKEYNDLFHGLGQIANYSHKIKIDPNVKPGSQQL